MITTFFVQARVCARLETGPLGSYLDTLITTLQTQGYAKNSIRQFLHNADAFTRWLVQQKLALADVNEAILNRYIATLRRPNSSRISGRLPKLSLGLKQVLEVLRRHGLVPPQLAPAPITEAEQWLHNFDHHLECVLGFSPGTRRNYLRYARRLIDSRFGSATPNWTTLSAQDVTDFVRQEADKLKPSTCRQPVGAVKAVLRFLAISGLVPARLKGAVPPIREWRQASLPAHLSADELARVLTASEEQTVTAHRDRAILLLLAHLGLRAGEVIKLRLDDIDWSNGCLLIRAGKTHRERSLPLPADVGHSLVTYLKDERPRSSERSLFLRARPPFGPLQSSVSITLIVQHFLKRAGVWAPRRGAHLLRHTAATRMVCKGTAFKQIADILGHQSLHSTATYAKLDLESLARVAMPWPGGAQ